MQTVVFSPDFESWRKVARPYLEADILPQDIIWSEENHPQSELFLSSESKPVSSKDTRRILISAEVIKKAKTASFNRDQKKWALFYRIFYRMSHGEPKLPSFFTDSDVQLLESMAHSVRKDLHKMHAFVRFRETQDESGEKRFVAWYRPDHPLLKLGAPFFERRFPAMNWSIFTEDESAHWDQKKLTFGPGISQSQCPNPDDVEALWKTYYAATFNPARIKLKTMQKEMPTRYWKTLPETEQIPKLLADAPERLKTFYENQPENTSQWLPKTQADLPNLKIAASQCQACPLHKDATQTVFGEGPVDSQIVLVGEQPGDQEDRQGHPFVGPAGKLLNDALQMAGIDRTKVYVTNAVKHFKWKPVPGSKFRLHQKPSSQEISACNPWLKAELDLLRPKIVVCLGVTAAQAIFGKVVTLKELRGTIHSTARCSQTLVTIHPSAILRMPTQDAKDSEFNSLVRDLKKARSLIE